MKLSAILEPMIAAGVSGDVILATVRAFEEQHGNAIEKEREKARARWRKWKANQDGKRLQTFANVSKQLARVEDSSSKEDISGTKEEVARKRAARLNADWTLPAEWRAEAISAGLPPERTDAEARRMHNWSLSDRNGAKLDWRATWRNWFGRALDSRPTGPPDKPKKVTVASMFRDEARAKGILPNDTPNKNHGRLETINRDRLAASTGVARRFAGSGGG